MINSKAEEVIHLPKLPALKRLREAQFLSQLDLAGKAGVSRATVVRLESGEVEATFQTSRKLAEALGVGPGELTSEGDQTA